MTIIFKCSACDQYLCVANKYGGYKLQCTVCQAIISVPKPSQETAKSKKISLKQINSDKSEKNVFDVQKEQDIPNASSLHLKLPSQEDSYCPHCGAKLDAENTDICPWCDRQKN